MSLEGIVAGIGVVIALALFALTLVVDQGLTQIAKAILVAADKYQSDGPNLKIEP